METAIIVALIAAASTIIGWLFNRKGTKEAEVQAARAHELREREVDWQRRGDIIADLSHDIERLREMKRAAQASCAAAQAASIKTIILLSEAVQRKADRELAEQAIKEAKKHGETHDV